jgi:3D (Asp-Asp-Asp) domain-containing protein
MRKATTIWTIVILGFMTCLGAAGYAQEAAQATYEKTKAEAKQNAESAAAAEREKPVHAYRLDFSVNELEDGKKINTRQYSLNLNADDANEIKIGTRVPVESGHEQFQYMDVGTSIWCRIGERPDGIPLSVRADISNFAIPDQGTGHESRPVVRQFKINASTLALPGKPMVVGSVDDPNSKRQFQLEVTVTKLR